MAIAVNRQYSISLLHFTSLSYILQTNPVSFELPFIQHLYFTLNTDHVKFSIGY